MHLDEVRRMLDEHPTVPLWPEAGGALGLTRGQTYKAAREGEIETLHFGRLKRVTTSWLSRKLGLDSASGTIRG